MKIAIFSLIILFLSIPLLAFTPLSEQPTYWLNSYNDAGTMSILDYPAGQWCYLDVDVDDGFVFVAGLLIITHGYSIGTEIADLHLYFGDGDGNLHPGAHAQTCTSMDGGERTNYGFWVPVIDGQIQFMWTKSTDGDWPEHPAYGLTITIQAGF